SIPHEIRSRPASQVDVAALVGRARADAGAGSRAERGHFSLRLEGPFGGEAARSPSFGASSISRARSRARIDGPECRAAARRSAGATRARASARRLRPLFDLRRVAGLVAEVRVPRRARTGPRFPRRPVDAWRVL